VVHLQRAPLELTILSLEHTSASLEFSLGLGIASPHALNPDDIRLVVSQPWYDPFRLVRVIALLPMESASLDPTVLCDAIHSVIKNMRSEAVLEVPSIPVTLPDDREHDGRLTHRLQTAMRECIGDPRASGVLVEIPVPAGITLRPGAAIALKHLPCWIPGHSAHPCHWPHTLR